MRSVDVEIACIFLEEAKHGMKMMEGDLKDYTIEKIDDAILTLRS